MKNRILLAVSVLLLSTACSTNALTGKKEFNIVSNDQLFPSAFAEYNQFLTENKVVTGTSDAALVQKVGAKIRAAVEKYYASKGISNSLAGYQWEYKLVQDKAVNAWCMPGGKIVVYSGILPVTKDEAGLATVLGHEVAHALLNHGAQRMSQSQAQAVGAAAVAVATSGQSAERQQAFQQYYGIGTQVGVILPFSRSHESEADEIGLTLMAIAGYNPDNALAFWQRMSAQSGGGSTPELLSTHPSDNTRINNIKKLIPTAKAEAAKLGTKY
ncbi:MAG: M48 family peptidase [Flavobacterium sp.]|uniref:M48 family metallopeptidase n=1 Tax=Flavobacterium sp. TaxID=239 RepID=UPI001215FD56|nr:M48 family metallopeptidase [Flavobacterium sp.]RZJ66612.1 MAG: M48 family peptidase [Flavobacterium sp.]